MKKILYLLSFLLLQVSVHAQKKSSTESRIKVTWETVENNYKGGNETYSKLTVTNLGREVLPASGWVLYFNAGNPRNMTEGTGAIKIEQVNGDFFKATPGKSFKGLSPGRSETVEVLSRNLIKKTDFPSGFYLVYTAKPNDAISVLYEAISSVDYKTQQKALAEQTYLANEKIEDIAPNLLPPILPTPSSVKKTKDIFTVDKQTKLIFDDLFESEANYLSAQLEQLLGYKPTIGSTEKQNVIILQKLTLPSKEAYKLQVTSNEIIIGAAGAEGIFYGIQSLRNLIPPSAWTTKPETVNIPGMIVSDVPRFPHRAFMMDIARNFQPKSQILKVIDMISLYKVNVLHMHFNDDEGWRIEIPGLPELTELGSKRGHTMTETDRLIPSFGSGPTVNASSGSGYLSREDYIEILKYATTRHVKVIPEFETPGHARAAIKSMDQRYRKLMKAGDQAAAEKYLLRDLNDQSVYRSIQGWSDNVINPALPSVYTFMEKLADEMIAMYKEASAPLHTIHFGGDEVPAGVWEKSPAVAELLKKEPGIGSVDEMWHYYFKKVNAILKARNLYLSGWEEIGLKKEMVNGKKQMVLDHRFASENFHTDVWNNLSPNEDLAYKLANAGYKVVLTNVTNLYIDLSYNRNYEEPGQYWGGFVDLDKPYRFMPFDFYKSQKEDEKGRPLKADHFAGKEKLTAKGMQNIVGLQSPLWSEIITSPSLQEYLLLPKILALAERAWADHPDWAKLSDPVKAEEAYQYAWSEFVNILAKRELPRLDHYAGGFRYRIPTPGLMAVDGMVKANVQFPEFEIRYTTDGSEPTRNSKLYSEPIPESKSLSFRVFNKNGRGGRTVKY